jgi:hypothetical protein
MAHDCLKITGHAFDEIIAHFGLTNIEVRRLFIPVNRNGQGPRVHKCKVASRHGKGRKNPFTTFIKFFRFFINFFFYNIFGLYLDLLLPFFNFDYIIIKARNTIVMQ